VKAYKEIKLEEVNGRIENHDKFTDLMLRRLSDKEEEQLEDFREHRKEFYSKLLSIKRELEKGNKVYIEIE